MWRLHSVLKTAIRKLLQSKVSHQKCDLVFLPIAIYHWIGRCTANEVVHSTLYTVGLCTQWVREFTNRSQGSQKRQYRCKVFDRSGVGLGRGHIWTHISWNLSPWQPALDRVKAKLEEYCNCSSTRLMLAAWWQSVLVVMVVQVVV